MDSRFFERKCFITTSDCLLDFMKEQKDDSSLTFNIEEDTKDQVIVYWGVPLSNGQGSIIARKQFKVSIHQLKEKLNIYEE